MVSVTETDVLNALSTDEAKTIAELTNDVSESYSDKSQREVEKHLRILIDKGKVHSTLHWKYKKVS